MSHFAIVAPPLYSHAVALHALALELAQRGHRMTFLTGNVASLAEQETERVAFHPLPASVQQAQRNVQQQSNGNLLRLIAAMSSLTDTLCQQLPAILQQLAVDALIVDEMEPAGSLVAEALGLPFISVACALPVNREPGLPLPVMPFHYAEDKRALRRFQVSERIYDALMYPHGQTILRHAQRFGLPERRRLDECLSPLAQISQSVPALDFPRRALPDCFHYVGALRYPPSPLVERSPRSTPRIFASLGTLQGHRLRLFRKIAGACASVGAEVTIAHCDGLTPAQADSLYACGATEVTNFVDQPRYVAEADLVITHGGLNTVLDALAAATPVLAVPLSFDQPAVAARLVYNGLGRRVSRFARQQTLADEIAQLLRDETLHQRLATARQQLNEAGGTPRAATLIEQAMTGSESVS